METKAVVYGPDVAVLVEQAMAALAVGIVGDQVESSDAAQRTVLLSVVDKSEEVLVGGRVDAELEGPGPERAVGASNCGWHNIPTHE
jgi:hypothetical protein